MRIFTIALLITACVRTAVAQPPAERRPFVQVSVISADSDAKSLLQSYVNRELRALGNVELAGARGDGTRVEHALMLSITAVPIRVRDEQVGYAIGVAYLLMQSCADS